MLDDSNRTPLLLLAETAITMPKKDRDKACEIAKMLIEAGSDLTSKNKAGKTIFDFCPAWKFYEGSAPFHAVKAKGMPASSHVLLLDALELSCLLKK